MSMSCTKAWHPLRKTDEHLRRMLVERRVGGASGGGMALTPRGRDLPLHLQQFVDETDTAMGDSLQRAPGEWPMGFEPVEEP